MKQQAFSKDPIFNYHCIKKIPFLLLNNPSFAILVVRRRFN